MDSLGNCRVRKRIEEQMPDRMNRHLCEHGSRTPTMMSPEPQSRYMSNPDDSIAMGTRVPIRDGYHISPLAYKRKIHRHPNLSWPLLLYAPVKISNVWVKMNRSLDGPLSNGTDGALNSPQGSIVSLASFGSVPTISGQGMGNGAPPATPTTAGAAG